MNSFECLAIAQKRPDRERLFRAGLVLGLGLVMGVSAQAESVNRTLDLKPAVGLDGKPTVLKAGKGEFMAFLVYSTQCPIANASCQEVGRLVGEFQSKQVRFVGICVDPDLTGKDVADHAREYAIAFPLVQDKSGQLARQLGASVTPEAVVLDDQGRVRYQGRIDDQFHDRLKRNPSPARHELQEALTMLTSGHPVAVASAPAVGCPLPEPKPAVKAPTYAREISRIIQKNCQECHSKGQIGPFPLETYEHARKRASDLAEVTSQRSMPPWKAERGFGQPLKHDRSLSSEVIQAFADWAEAGAPLGDISEMPAPVTFPTSWKLGTPDLVLQMPESYEVPATGADIYRNFVLPTNIPNDVYISAVEFKPGNRTVSHHMLGWVETKGEARKKDEQERGPGYISYVGAGVKTQSDLGGWAAGRGPTVLPEGVGYELPAKADVILQMHYHPSGKVEKDLSAIGLYFNKKPIKATMQRISASNFKFTIPAGSKDHELKAEWVIPVDVTAHGASPHMHLIGKSMTMTAQLPNGRVVDLLRVPDWDFNWQTSYEFLKPLDLPKGTIVKVVAHYDNSSENRNNPNNPPKEMKWGPATTDEMCVGFIMLTKKGQDLTRPGEKNDFNDIIQESQKAQRERANAEALGVE